MYKREENVYSINKWWSGRLGWGLEIILKFILEKSNVIAISAPQLPVS
jgi:hypothetical protein